MNRVQKSLLVSSSDTNYPCLAGSGLRNKSICGSANKITQFKTQKYV